MKDMPAREKLDLAEMVAQYLVLAASLDKASAQEEYDRANELSLELAMVLPTAIYRAMVEAVAHPDGKANAASVAIMMRKELLAPLEGDLQASQVVFHAPGAAVVERHRGKAH